MKNKTPAPYKRLHKKLLNLREGQTYNCLEEESGRTLLAKVIASDATYATLRFGDGSKVTLTKSSDVSRSNTTITFH